MHTLELTTDELKAIREALEALGYNCPGLNRALTKVKAELKRTEAVLTVPAVAGIATPVSLRMTTDGSRL